MWFTHSARVPLKRHVGRSRHSRRAPAGPPPGCGSKPWKTAVVPSFLGRELPRRPDPRPW